MCIFVSVLPLARFEGGEGDLFSGTVHPHIRDTHTSMSSWDRRQRAISVRSACRGIASVGCGGCGQAMDGYFIKKISARERRGVCVCVARVHLFVHHIKVSIWLCRVVPSKLCIHIYPVLLSVLLFSVVLASVCRTWKMPSGIGQGTEGSGLATLPRMRTSHTHTASPHPRSWGRDHEPPRRGHSFIPT